jgi:hypothetical protein
VSDIVGTFTFAAIHEGGEAEVLVAQHARVNAAASASVAREEKGLSASPRHSQRVDLRVSEEVLRLLGFTVPVDRPSARIPHGASGSFCCRFGGSRCGLNIGQKLINQLDSKLRTKNSLPTESLPSVTQKY